MKKKVRKPRVCREIVGYKEVVAFQDKYVVTLCPKNLYADECRKLAAWLIKAADYLEAKETK
jgi:hypothetical protein